MDGSAGTALEAMIGVAWGSGGGGAEGGAEGGAGATYEWAAGGCSTAACDAGAWEAAVCAGTVCEAAARVRSLPNSSTTDGPAPTVITPPHTEQRARIPDDGILVGSTRNTDRHSGHETFTDFLSWR